MSTQQNKAAFLDGFREAFQKRNSDAFLHFLAPNVVFHLAGLPGPLHGAEAVKEWGTQYLSAWDVHFTIENVVAEGDIVAARWSVVGHHIGEYLGIPPTGKPIAYTQLYMARFTEGKPAEVWVMFDTLSAVQQLGFFPKGKPPRALLQLIIWLRQLGRKGSGPAVPS